MGKKSKKMKDNELPSANVGKLEPEDTISETNNSTDSIKKSKKKNRKRDLNGTMIEDAPVHVKSEEVNDGDTLGIPKTMKSKKEKKKKHTKLHEEELTEEVQSDTDTDKLHQDVPKKKKKKSKLLEGEDKSSMKHETCVKVENHEPEKNSKEKKNKNTSLNEPNADKEKVPKIQNEDTKQKKKKGKKKAKTGVPILNNEESQVTEEDIDRFIDELDEEDNKQYEDWVKLLDDRLSKKPKTE